jgi:hypothetical protein
MQRRSPRDTLRDTAESDFLQDSLRLRFTGSFTRLSQPPRPHDGRLTRRSYIAGNRHVKRLAEDSTGILASGRYPIDLLCFRQSFGNLRKSFCEMTGAVKDDQWLLAQWVFTFKSGSRQDGPSGPSPRRRPRRAVLLSPIAELVCQNPLRTEVLAGDSSRVEPEHHADSADSGCIPVLARE